MAPLPPPSQPLSLTDYALSLLSTTTAVTNNTTALIDAATDHHLTYPTFLRQIKSLSSFLQSHTTLSKGHVALILIPSSIHVPVLYFSLLSLGVTIAPANPLSSPSELSHFVHLINPIIAFSTSSTAAKIPKLPLGTVIVDSPSFLSVLNSSIDTHTEPRPVETSQSDTAAILFSSGTTGRVKGVLLTHRNFIALIGGFCFLKHGIEDEPHRVSFFPLPLFHVIGFFMMVRTMAMGDTLVLMQRFDFGGMLKAVEKYRITHMPVSPPLITAFTKSELVKKYDVSSIRSLGCGGAPLGKEVAESFKAKFPNMEIVQVTTYNYPLLCFNHYYCW
jgi:4-coumarate--CoA ligase